MAVVPGLADPKAVYRYADILTEALLRLCGSLEAPAIEALLKKVELLQLDVGETLYRQGDAGDDMHIVLTGRLEVQVEGEDGALRVLAHPQPGDVVGEIALLAGSPRAATVVAVRDTTLGALPRSALEALLADDPGIFSRVARMIVTRLSGGQGHIARRAGTRTILLVPLHASVDRAAFGRGLRQALLRFGSVLQLDSVTAAARLAASGGDDYGRFLDDCERAYDYVILEADPEPSAWSRRCHGYADRVVLVADAGMLPIRTPLEHWLFERESQAGTYADVHLALLHKGNGPPQGTREWLAARVVTQHHHIRQDKVAEMAADMARLARFLTDNAVALVLAGGGARGFAHFGVIRALREVGVPVDAVGGASFGALAATALARGLGDEEALAEQHFAFSRDHPLNDYTLPVVSLLRGGRLDRVLRKALAMRIEDLWIPFFAVSGDLSANRMHVHDRGPLWRAVRASVSLPGVLPPAVENGHLLVDGAVVNNLPVDVMRERVRGRVIAVDLAVEREYQIDREELPSGLDYLKSRLMPWRATIRVPTMSRVIMKATMLASRKEVGAARRAADLYLNPPVDAYDFLDWGRLREIVDAGYRHALPAIEAWAGKHANLCDRRAPIRAWWSAKGAAGGG